MGDLVEDAGERKIYGIIYVATNVLRPVKQLQYVGKTKRTMEKRWISHTKESLGRCRQLISRAIKKWTPAAFQLEQIDVAYSLQELNEKEKYWIKKLDTLAPNGYNLTEGGDGGTGYKHTPETLKKLSIASSGKRHTEETKRKISRGCSGRKMSEEAKNSISKSRLGHPTSEEARAKMSAAWIGRIVSKETRAKQSAASTGRVFSKETRAKLSAASTGKVFSEETRRKISQTLSGKKLPVRLTCRKGHVFNEVNTYNVPSGGRRCWTCFYLAQPKRTFPERLKPFLLESDKCLR